MPIKQFSMANQDNQPNKEPGRVANTTSFASILAGVQRLRESSSEAKVQGSESANSASLAPKTATATTATATVPAGKSAKFEAPLSSQRAAVSANTHNVAPKTSSFSKTSLYQSRYARSKVTKQVVSKIAIHPSQKHNPLLSSIGNTPYEFTSMVKTDYLINNSISVIFLSLKYHKLRPNYIYDRLKKLGVQTVLAEGSSKQFDDNQLKILLLLLDSETNYMDSLKELTKLCIYSNITLLAAWSYQEAGEYVAMLKKLDSASSYKITGSSSSNDKFDIIKGLQKQDYYSRLVASLGSIRSVSKPDVGRIAGSGYFKNFKELIADDGTQLQLIEGFGNTKVKRFKSVISEPFLYNKDYDNDEKVKEWREKCRKRKEEKADLVS